MGKIESKTQINLEAELKDKDAKIKEQEVAIEALKLKTRPRSLGFFRSRFR